MEAETSQCFSYSRDDGGSFAGINWVTWLFMCVYAQKANIYSVRCGYIKNLQSRCGHCYLAAYILIQEIL